MQEIFSSMEKKLLPTAKNNIFIGRSSSVTLIPNAALPQAEQQLLHRLCTWTRRAIFGANGCTLPSRRWKLRIARSSP
jgi:hypothetical protein